MLALIGVHGVDLALSARAVLVVLMFGEAEFTPPVVVLQCVF